MVTVLTVLKRWDVEGADARAVAWLWDATLERYTDGSFPFRCARAAATAALAASPGHDPILDKALALAGTYFDGANVKAGSSLEAADAAMDRASKTHVACAVRAVLGAISRWGEIVGGFWSHRGEPAGAAEAFGLRLCTEAVAYSVAACGGADDPIIAAMQPLTERLVATAVERVASKSWGRGEPVQALVSTLLHCHRTQREAAGTFGTDIDSFFRACPSGELVLELLYRTGTPLEALASFLLKEMRPHLGPSDETAREMASVLEEVISGREPPEAILLWRLRAQNTEKDPASNVDPIEQKALQVLGDIGAAVALAAADFHVTNLHLWIAHVEMGSLDRSPELFAIADREKATTLDRLKAKFEVGSELVERPRRSSVEAWDTRSGAWGLLLRMGARIEEVTAAKERGDGLQDWWASTDAPSDMLQALVRLAPSRAVWVEHLAKVARPFVKHLPAEAEIASAALVTALTGIDVECQHVALAALVDTDIVAARVQKGRLASSTGDDEQRSTYVVKWIGEACALLALSRSARSPELMHNQLADRLVWTSALLDPRVRMTSPLGEADLATHRRRVAASIRRAHPTPFASV